MIDRRIERRTKAPVPVTLRAGAKAILLEHSRTKKVSPTR